MKAVSNIVRTEPLGRPHGWLRSSSLDARIRPPSPLGWGYSRAFAWSFIALFYDFDHAFLNRSITLWLVAIGVTTMFIAWLAGVDPPLSSAVELLLQRSDVIVVNQLDVDKSRASRYIEGCANSIPFLVVAALVFLLVSAVLDSFFGWGIRDATADFLNTYFPSSDDPGDCDPRYGSC